MKEQLRLQQVSRERQRIKTQWQAWQQRMERDYDMVAAFEQQSIGNLLKIESWERFLGNWKNNNPYSEQDKKLRSKAQRRIIYWEKEIQEQKSKQQVVLKQESNVVVELKGRYAVSKLRVTNSCVSCDLQDANLRNAELRNAILKGTNLENANLREANLRGASLYRANLIDANLENADLRGANLAHRLLRVI